MNGRRATAWRNGCVAVCLAVAGMLRGGILESPPVSLDDIRWKKFQPASEVYIDTTLQFTPAFDALPGVDATKDKLAIWLNVDTSGAHPVTNLCVYAARADLAPAPTVQKAGLRLGVRGAVTTVTPSSRLTFRRRARIAPVVFGSSALVASSQSRTFGCVASARAIAILCCRPPES